LIDLLLNSPAAKHVRNAVAHSARTMMLVYNLPRTDAIFDHFGGFAGSAYCLLVASV
jgi:hypothetical protein